MIRSLLLFNILMLVVALSTASSEYDDMLENEVAQEIQNYLIPRLRLIKTQNRDIPKTGGMDEVLRYSRSRSKFTPEMIRPRFGKRNSMYGSPGKINFMENPQLLEN